jgi:hypothetical protein
MAGRRDTVSKTSSNELNLSSKLPTVRSKGQLSSPFKSQQLLSTQNNPAPTPIITVNPFQKSLFGDVFGTRSLGDSRSMLGILYRARVQESVHMKKKEKSLDEAKADTDTNLVGSQTSIVDIMESDSEEDNDVSQEMNSRLQLAMTLRNWSATEHNNDYIIHEGGVHALIALAGTDDQAIRRCVASAFYHLSSRKENRQELITLGAAQGVISIATQGLRSWKIAQLCAWTLCNLSMEEDSQAMAIMAQEGAITALGILFGLRQQRLLPVCVQALYNLTCAEHFKGMERILKSLINIPQTGFDSSYYLVKALVNCCRFYWMRSRIIEDGALASLVSFVASIPQRANIDECVVLVATCLRLLSESSTSSNVNQSSSSNQSSQIRIDMVSKGSIELINTLMQYCDERSWEHNVITLFNLLHIPPQQFPNATLETAVNIVTDVALRSKAENTLLACSACIYMAVRDPNRFVDRHNIPIRISNAMPIVLAPAHALTKYFAIASAGYLFFSNVSGIIKIESLLENFVEAGPMALADDKSAHVFAMYLARLSEDHKYMAILASQGLLLTIVELLLQLVKEKKKDMVVQESACIGVVRIALQLNKDMPEWLPKQISEMMFELLSLRDIFVLRNTICGIRCLGEYGLCHNELLSDAFLERVAGIVVRYHDDKILVENCLAVLAVFSYDEASHNGLAVESVMTVLFQAASSTSTYTTTHSNGRVHSTHTEKTHNTISIRGLVATTLCNISVDERVRACMVDKGVVDVLSNLSGATSELIQELCAKCICNITASTTLHTRILKHGILQTLLMISLVRAVANTTKQLCARALLNLLEDANIEALKAAGAVRVFATLSAIDNLPIQNICARAFLIFTGNESMREDIVSRLPVVHAIFGMVCMELLYFCVLLIYLLSQVKCSSLRVNVMVGLAICNLLVCPLCQKAAINAGGLSVLKIIASMDIDELTEATARVIVNLILEPTLHPNLLRESLVPVLVLFLQHPSRTAFECSLHALSCMAQHDIFHNMMIDKGCITALVGALMSGRISTHMLGVEVCRTLCLLSYDQKRSESMIVQGNIMIAPHIVYRNGTCTAQAATMMAMLFRNLSYDRTMYKHIIDQDVLRLLKCLYTDFKSECAGVCRSAIIFMHNIAHDSSLHQALLKQGLMSMLLAVVTTAVEHGKKHFNRLHAHGHGHGHAPAHGHGNAPGHGHHGNISPNKDHMIHHHSKTFVDTTTTSLYGHGLEGKPFSPPPQQLQQHGRHSATGAATAPFRSPNASFDVDHLDDTINPHQEDRFDPNHTKYLILTKRDIYYMARTLNLVSSSSTCHEAIVEGNAVQICDHLLISDADTVTQSRHEVASALCALSSSKKCRQVLFDQGASELLVMLARSASNRDTQSKCSLALGYLSEITKVSKDVVGTLLLLNLKNEEMQESMLESQRDTERDRERGGHMHLEDPTHGKHHVQSHGHNIHHHRGEHASSASSVDGDILDVDGTGNAATANTSANIAAGSNTTGTSRSATTTGSGRHKSPTTGRGTGRFGDTGNSGIGTNNGDGNAVGVVGSSSNNNVASATSSSALAASQSSLESGPKTLRSMIKDGLLHRKDNHTIVIDERRSSLSLDQQHHQHLQSLLDLGLTENSSGSSQAQPVPELKITAIEARILQGHYNVYKFSPITLNSVPQPAGMAAKSSLGNLYQTQPSISAERNLEPPDRLEKLRVIIKTWAFIKEPLSKEFSQLGEYIMADELNNTNSSNNENNEGTENGGHSLSKFRRNKSMNSPRGKTASVLAALAAKKGSGPSGNGSGNGGSGPAGNGAGGLGTPSAGKFKKMFNNSVRSGSPLLDSTEGGVNASNSSHALPALGPGADANSAAAPHPLFVRTNGPPSGSISPAVGSARPYSSK